MKDNTSFTDAAQTWNERFQAPDYVFGTEPNAYLREHTALWTAGQRVLCVADGEGRNSVWLARQGLAVDAFDISDVGVAKARKLAESAGVRVDYSVSDWDDWPWPVGAYDGVVAIFVQFAGPQTRGQFFGRLVDALKPGGILVLQGYSPGQLAHKTGGPKDVSHMYTADLMREAFATMEIIDLRDYEADLSEGTRHTGRSALIGLVARKR